MGGWKGLTLHFLLISQGIWLVSSPYCLHKPPSTASVAEERNVNLGSQVRILMATEAEEIPRDSLYLLGVWLVALQIGCFPTLPFLLCKPVSVSPSQETGTVTQ